MSGDATFSGTTYQQRVIAYVYVHILAQMRLGWLTATDDTPLATSGEVRGPGDDARIEFGDGTKALEVQAKHGLTAGAELDEVVERLRPFSTRGDETRVVLAVDRNSTRVLYKRFADDLHRLRSGRQDGLGPQMLRILAGSVSRDDLSRLFVVPLDVDQAHEPEAKQMIQLLEPRLETPDQAAAALAVLITDAGEICARRLRRNRKDLEALLGAAGIKLKPSRRDEKWHSHLDFCRNLLQRRHASAALAELSRIEHEIARVKVEPLVWYRLHQQRATGLLQLNRPEQALGNARRALDIDASGLHALVIAAAAAAFGGDFEAAAKFADQAVAAKSGSGLAWAAKLQVTALAGTPAPVPPADVASSVEYRTAVAQMSLNGGEFERVLNVTAELLSEGIRSEEVLLFRAKALLFLSQRGDGTLDLDRCRETERFASELIDLIDDDAHPYTHHGLVARANARLLLNDAKGADADFERARDLAADDPDVIGNAASWKFQTGDTESALQILHHPITDRTPKLLVLRSRTFAKRDDRQSARRDLEDALRQIGDVRDPDSLRFAAAEIALSIQDDVLAEGILNGVSARCFGDPQYAILRGQIALARKDVESAVDLYYVAATWDHVNWQSYLTDLGARLSAARHAADAVRAFEALADEALPAQALPYFIGALLATEDFGRAQGLIDRIGADGELPLWALRVATDIAIRRDDPDAAVRYLTELVNRGDSTVPIRIELLIRLIEIGRVDEAQTQLDLLVSHSAALSPVQRMQVAQLLGAAGRQEEALSVGFRAFRDQPDNSELHRAFIGLALTAKSPLPPVARTGPDTHVRLSNQNGATRSHTIYSEPPINRLQGEMSVETAVAAGLMDLRVGDEIVQNEGNWQEQRWRVDAILPAIQWAVQDAMLRYEERFPDAPVFMARFGVGEEPSVKDFAPIVASLEARKDQVARVFALYREQTLPLGFVVKVLGGTVVDVMAQVNTQPETFGPLFVEWADQPGQDRSRTAALEAREIVLTRSALHTASELGLLPLLAERYGLLAPQTLRQELREEVKEAEKLVAEGYRSIARGDAGLAVTELEAGHPILVSRLERVRALLSWMEKSVRLEPRPLESIGSKRARDEHGRDIVGRSSFDAVALTQSRNLTMYADDLGLRRIAPNDSAVKSISTIALLGALAEAGALSADERDQYLLTLLRLHYVFIPPSSQLLEFVVRSSNDLPHSLVASAFGLLGGPLVTVRDAAVIAAKVIRASVTSPVQLMSAAALAERALSGMATRWPRSLCSLSLRQAIEEELALLPQHLREVQRVCARFK